MEDFPTFADGDILIHCSWDLNSTLKDETIELPDGLLLTFVVDTNNVAHVLIHK